MPAVNVMNSVDMFAGQTRLFFTHKLIYLLYEGSK